MPEAPSKELPLYVLVHTYEYGMDVHPFRFRPTAASPHVDAKKVAKKLNVAFEENDPDEAIEVFEISLDDVPTLERVGTKASSKEAATGD